MEEINKYLMLMALLVFSHEMFAQDASHNYILHEVMLNALGTSQNTTVSYLDGIGRPSREVTNSLGTSGSYVSTMTLYDACGRPSCTYFPTAIGSSPSFLSESGLCASSRSFYGDNFAYTSKNYDVLQREMTNFGGGDLWQNNSRDVSKEYGVNNESVKRYIPTASNGRLLENGEYAPGTLHTEITKDEDGKLFAIYKNRLGQKILERRASDVDTYFVYDDLGNLRFVLSPNYQDDEDLEASAYEYRYDGRGRCVWKRLPGTQYMQYWYDDNDRLIYEQDGVLRAQKLVRFYLYDGLGRIVVQGVSSSCDLTCAHAKVQMSTSASFLGVGYVPIKTGVSSGQLEIVSYYDSYSFLQLPCFSELNKSILERGTLEAPIGLETGSIAFTSQGTALCHVVYYDKRGQAVNEYVEYPNQTVVSKSSAYSFTGQPLEANYVVMRGSQSLTYKLKNTYHPYNDKLKKIELVAPSNESKVIMENTYDEVGRLKNVKRGDKVGAIEYEYNVRGWVTLIEDNTFSEKLYYADSEVSSPCYNGNISCQIWKNANDGIVRGYAYSYDDNNRLTSAVYGESTTLKNNRNRYTESVSVYDKNSSILSLQRYGKGNAGSYGLIDDLSYNVDGNQIRFITDKAGRLLYAGSFDFKQISTDEYAYDANGGLVSDPNKGITSISYDNLGYPKSISYKNGNGTNFCYSSMGEKLSVQHQTGLSTTLSPLEKENLGSTQSSIVSQKDYVGNVIYEQGSAAKILFDGGYYSLVDNLCHYFTRDHLGSIRTMVNENGILEQSLHYYPFGGIYGDACYNADLQGYKYNGKELERMHGLDWYDYGERLYDAAKVSWDRMDKLCEDYYHLNPYDYCGGNPICMKEVLGMYWFYYAQDENNEPTWNWRNENVYRTGQFDSKGKEIVLQGYEAVVEYKGSYNERLSKDGNMLSEDALLADVNVYGPNGADDVQHYKGFTMSSNPSRFGVVKDGNYLVQKVSRPGPFGSVWALNGRGRVPEWSGFNPKHPSRTPAYLDGVFIHRSNWNGFAGEFLKNGVWHGVSEGCLLVSPAHWNKFNKQLSKVNSFLLDLKRK